jgi:hypothetical protein
VIPIGKRPDFRERPRDSAIVFQIHVSDHNGMSRLWGQSLCCIGPPRLDVRYRTFSKAGGHPPKDGYDLDPDSPAAVPSLAGTTRTTASARLEWRIEHMPSPGML